MLDNKYEIVNRIDACDLNLIYDIYRFDLHDILHENILTIHINVHNKKLDSGSNDRDNSYLDNSEDDCELLSEIDESFINYSILLCDVNPCVFR